jgi:hypothetical protein
MNRGQIPTRLLLLFLVAIVSYGCITAQRRTWSASEEKRIRAIIDDRRNWVDPVHEF